jgi:hypothetical protein
MLANSARQPEAARIPGYEAMAESLHQGRLAVDEFTTAPSAAAAAVLEAILADDGPLRWPCDRLGGELLTAWQADPDGCLSAR